MICHAKAFQRRSREKSLSKDYLEESLPRGAGEAGWGAPPEPPFSVLHPPCETASISQGRPILAPEFTESGQEEAGKELTIPVYGGSSLPASLSRKQPFTGCLLGGGSLPGPPSPQAAREGTPMGPRAGPVE
jgi:hypothetical protein